MSLKERGAGSLKLNGCLQLANQAVPSAALVQSVPAGFDPAGLNLPPVSAPWSEALRLLGEDLFFDHRLSKGTSGISCASCHDASKGFAGAGQFDVGFSGATLRRHTPSILNRAFSSLQFWDGRVGSLEAQSVEPLKSLDEMGFGSAGLGDAVAKIAGIPGYQEEFELVFGTATNPAITINRLQDALSAYQRGLFSAESHFDLGTMANMYTSPPETPFGDPVLGEHLFNGKARCSACHSGSNFTDEAFHNTGSDRSVTDAGRMEATGLLIDESAFKTPSLRDVMLRRDFLFHDGSHDIDEVIDFYNSGGKHKNAATPEDHDGVKDLEIFPLGLTTIEKLDLKAFLWALNGKTINAPNAPDEFEPNNDWVSARVVGVGVHNLEITVNDFDFFFVTGPATVRVDFTLTPGDGDLDMLMSNLAKTSTSYSASSSALFEMLTVPAGQHYIAVGNFTGATNKYDLTITVP